MPLWINPVVWIDDLLNRRACPARDHEGREQLWMLYKISKKFRGLLDGYVQTGKLAAENLRLEKERRFKIF